MGRLLPGSGIPKPQRLMVVYFLWLKYSSGGLTASVYFQSPEVVALTFSSLNLDQNDMSGVWAQELAEPDVNPLGPIDCGASVADVNLQTATASITLSGLQITSITMNVTINDQNLSSFLKPFEIRELEG